MYRAFNRETGEFLAIKEIAIKDMPQSHLASVQSEVEMLHSLQHPRIVRCLETVRTTDHLYIVQELMTNGSLASVVKKFGRFPEPLVATYTRQVLEGLDWLHSHGVCHRDIKGANVLIAKEGQVRLADLGVARKLSDTTGVGSVVGTPYWMAPEIIQMSRFTTASDIWSLGCTLIELLAGEPPYYDLAPISALYRIVQDAHPPLPRHVSAAATAFMMECFTRDPAARPSAATLLQHAWLQAADADADASAAAAVTVAAADPAAAAAAAAVAAAFPPSPQIAPIGGGGPPQAGVGGEGAKRPTPEHRVGRLVVQTVVQTGEEREEELHSVADQRGGCGSEPQSHVGRTPPATPPRSQLQGPGGRSRPSPLDSARRPSGHRHGAGGGARHSSSGRSGGVGAHCTGLGGGASGSGSHLARAASPGNKPLTVELAATGKGAGSQLLSLEERSQLLSPRADDLNTIESLSPREWNRPASAASGQQLPQLPQPLPASQHATAAAAAGAHRQHAHANTPDRLLLPLSCCAAGAVAATAAAAAAAGEQPPPQLAASTAQSPAGGAEAGGAGGGGGEDASDTATSRSQTMQSAVQQGGGGGGGGDGPGQAGGVGAAAPPKHEEAHRTAAGAVAQAPTAAALPGSPAMHGHGGGMPGGSHSHSHASSPQVAAAQSALDTPEVAAAAAAAAVATLGRGGAHDEERPLCGFVWKRGSGLRSFAYQRRFFYLQHGCLCYRSGEPGLSAETGELVFTHLVEKRIPLSSVLNVRVHSKLKFEFELVCAARSFRLRTPSAQALAVWVTTISAEWMKVQGGAGGNSHSMQQAVAARQLLDAATAAQHSVAAQHQLHMHGQQLLQPPPPPPQPALVAAASAAAAANAVVAAQQPLEVVVPGATQGELLTWRPTPPARHRSANDASGADAVRGYTREAFQGRTASKRGLHALPPPGTPPLSPALPAQRQPAPAMGLTIDVR